MRMRKSSDDVASLTMLKDGKIKKSNMRPVYYWIPSRIMCKVKGDYLVLKFIQQPFQNHSLSYLPSKRLAWTFFIVRNANEHCECVSSVSCWHAHMKYKPYFHGIWMKSFQEIAFMRISHSRRTSFKKNDAARIIQKQVCWMLTCALAGIG